ncbi:hypothetical protein A0U94_14825 (plasmid) [Gluconobacter albidus]|uniref:CHAT domain-containing protein n=1 Tax=Gluconobacter albidus TaxID=318683 RepID=UPI00098A7638|nr:CHAT domain-containing protein [Gluconobacter albidus]AQS92439.1 hypothetical protein A0U94_14825 [Gluconobacter albidus]
MANYAKIDMIIHREGADAMMHSARTDKNIAVAPNTAHVSLAPLIAVRSKILDSFKGGEKLTPAELTEIGEKIAEVLLAGSVRDLYNGTANGTSVQLSLCACDPELKAIPWEFVVWPDLKSAPHDKRSICRLVEGTTTKALPALKLDAGIRIMLVVSQPTDQPAVEWIETQKTLSAQIEVYTPAVVGEKMTFKVCEASAAAAVREEVQAFDPHIVHFIGHGRPEGLVFTKHKTTTSKLVGAGTVYSVLASKSTRLLILSACDTANVGSDIASLIPIAERVVQAGVPAVVANQMPISLRSIHTFCGALYGDLLRDGNIDWAVNVGRIAMGVAFDNHKVAAVEWGVPVLYRRPGCSQLFQKGAGA